MDDGVDVFIGGTTIDLVAVTEEMVETTDWSSWFNSEDTTYFMQKHYFPNTKNLQKKYYLEYIESSNSTLQLGIWHRKDACLIGMISLDSINYINRSAGMGAIIGLKKYRNLVHHVEACKLIIRHGFESLNLNRIFAGSIRKDQDQIFSRMLGFHHEGVSKSAVFKRGTYHDVYNHAILWSDYLNTSYVSDDLAIAHAKKLSAGTLGDEDL